MLKQERLLQRLWGVVGANSCRRERLEVHKEVSLGLEVAGRFTFVWGQHPVSLLGSYGILIYDHGPAGSLVSTSTHLFQLYFGSVQPC